MIRIAKESDAQAIGLIYSASWKEAYKGIVPQKFLNSLTAQNCTPTINEDSFNLVAEENGKVVGVINLSKGRDKGTENNGEIAAIYVLPEFWLKGHGAELFNSAIQLFAEENFGEFYLWVLKDNLQARKFYEKMHMTLSAIEKTICIGGKDLVEVKYLGVTTDYLSI